MTDLGLPSFSIVIPALNEEAVLGDCLISLSKQTFSGVVEVIVVDNGSSDNTAAVASSYGARVISEPCRGVCFARQRGLEAATSPIVVSTDADTTFASTWLETIDSQFQTHPRAVAVAGPCVYVDGPWWSAVWLKLLFGSVALVARLTGKLSYVTATNLAFRRDTLDGYNTRLTQGGDELDVLRRLQRRGQVVFVPDNPTLTSSRRLSRGLLYTAAVSLVYHYVLAYVVNRVTGRRVFGSAPPFRSAEPLTNLSENEGLPGADSGIRS